MTAAFIVTVLFAAAAALARAIWVRLGRCDDVHQRSCLANLGRIARRNRDRPAHRQVVTRHHRHRPAGPAHRRRTGASCTVDRARSTAA